LDKNKEMETSGTSARPFSCYSSLLQYGSGKFLPISSPTPISTFPAIYNLLEPRTNIQYVPIKQCDDKCAGYRKFGQLEQVNTFYGN
jgi:hypothetical protein